MKHIVAYDVESTGLDTTKDRIVQLTLIKYDYDSKKIIGTFSTYVRPDSNCNISYSAYAKHGLTADTLKDAPAFKDIAQKVYDFFNGCSVLTYNGLRFDNNILMHEFGRCGINWNPMDYEQYDAFIEEKERNGNTLEDTFKRYYGKTMEECGLQAHDSLADVKATISVFVKQQQEKEYGPIELLVPDNAVEMKKFDSSIPAFSKWGGKVVPCFSIGKYRGLPVEFVCTIDKGYIAWCCGDKASFCKETKEWLMSQIK